MHAAYALATASEVVRRDKCSVADKLAVELNPRLLMPKELAVHGIFLPASSATEQAETHRGLYEAMAAGALTPMVGATFPLADAALAQVEVMEPSAGGKAGNIVLTVREE